MGIGNISLSHKSERLCHILKFLPFPDERGTDSRVTELFGLLDKGLQLLIIGEPFQRLILVVRAIDIFEQLGIFVNCKIVCLSHKEDGGVVNIVPDLQSWSAFHLQLIHHFDNVNSLKGLLLAFLCASIVWWRFQSEHHPPIPHHRAEVFLQKFVAGIMAPGFILAVVLLVVEDRGVSPT